jgi:hypothetical protein
MTKLLKRTGVSVSRDVDCLLDLSFASALLRTLLSALGDDAWSTLVVKRVVHIYLKISRVFEC